MAPMISTTSLLLFLASFCVVTASPVPLLISRDTTYDFTSSINASLPNVTIFATGGTIASQGTTNTQTVGYSIGLGVQQLVDAVPELLNISNINGYQISNVASGSVNSSILLTLASSITEELSKPEIAGVVVTHGTDSLEETAFFLDLVINSSKPVILAGAMRPATALSADGPLNLYQAIRLASSANARNRGALITLNDRIGSAFYTTKNNANSLDTFYSTEAGQLGFFINQVPYFYFAPARPMGQPYFDVSNLTSLPQIDILYAHQDMDAQLTSLAVAGGAEGLVFAGMGAGGLSGVASTAAEAVFNATSIPMVASHRSADGFVPPATDDDMISSGFYNPQKARVLLQLAVAKGYGLVEIGDVFASSYPSA
ncbi:Putative asparaginase/glutaminase, L-asparaginase, Asparaginase/glutaminase-like superfamily [Septoria linicola]|uniref:asparaginase n=1 Tax=Septoria linicola TaxID=215465 RepID=A0A9Q9ACP9_9PEZI|nr:putative asparaginase/glutaminase, L-asparaginase, Asparaginase/glutaminase-like superfamily [Septoria linicola]USW47134.1 Putative asparaginase/glutaminase, L-asparaginase, Asparaginase/glutaminase-like superfamily [Septoria linicola]